MRLENESELGERGSGEDSSPEDGVRVGALRGALLLELLIFLLFLSI